MFNYSKLSGKIKEKCGTQYRFAEYMGMANPTLSQKLQSKSEFTQDEIMKAVEILSLNRSELPDYFFCTSSSENINSIAVTEG